MKKLFMALVACLSITVSANSLHAPNEAGGRIVITDRPCPSSEKLRMAYAVEGSGEVHEGCWAFFDGLVHIFWPDKGVRTAYPPNIFIPSEAKRGKSEDV
jgi:hypothetical protein